MDLERLRERLPKKVGKDLVMLYDRYRSEHGTGDVSSFVASLHERGLLTSEQLLDLLTSDVTFTLSETIGAEAGPTGVAASSANVVRKGARYRLLGLLGRGAMGEVHVARDRDLHRNVAVKRMDPAIAGNETLARRFLTEVQITAQLDHPGIVPVYSLDVPEDGAAPTYAMKLIRGRTLEKFLDDVKATYKAGKQPDDEHDLPARLELFLQVCNAIHYAHTRGVIHRDLKPENIMVGPFHEVIVMDWGIARLIGGKEPITDVSLAPDKASQTQLGTAIGSPPYMSPEQAEGRNDELDGRSDQCSLGLVLFEIVALKRAYKGKTALGVLNRAANAEKEPFEHAFGDKIPRELRAIVDKATALEAKDRYADVEALADDVRRFLRDEAVLARPDSVVQRVGRWISKHRQTTLAAVLSLVMLVVATGAGTLVLGLAALEASRYAAQVREEHLSEVLGVVGRQSHRMDTEFQSYEALLTGLQFATEHVLRNDPVLVGGAPARFYMSPEFKDPATAPADLGPSKFYAATISTDWPDNTLAPGLDRATVERRLEQLAGLTPHFQEILAESGGSDLAAAPRAAQVKRIRDEGVPVVWAYVALDEGILTALPGTGDYPADYDPRPRPWFVAAKAKPGPQWGAAYVDPSGMGLLVPCSMAVHDADGRFLGVAAMDISITHIIDALLDPAGLPAPVEAYLVDGDGKVVVQSSLKDEARTAKEHTPVPFEHPEVIERVKAGEPTGHLELSEPDGTEKLLAWSRLESVDWTYVIEGDSDALVGAW